MRNYVLEQIYSNQVLLEEGRKDRYMELMRGIPEGFAHREIQWAMQTLKKDNTIVWYLRYAKLMMVNEYLQDRENEGLSKWRQKFIYRVSNDPQTKADPAQIKTSMERYQTHHLNTLRTKLEHFMSLNLPEIENYDFGWAQLAVPLNKFSEFEDEWKKTQKDETWIDITEELEDGDIEIIKEYGDGYAWLDLKRPYCKQEGNAMGHCGNTASFEDEDTVLSFRKLDKKEERMWTRPSLTFILREGGVLGEMKGRANEKPQEKYHPYIVDLLMLEGENRSSSRDTTGYLVLQILGGGYLPQSNFDLSDLSNEVAESLFEKRPELKTLVYYYNENGFDEYVQEKLKELTLYVKTEGKYSLFKDFDSLYDFIEELPSGSMFGQYFDYITGEQIMDSYGTPDQQVFHSIYEDIIHQKPEIENSVKAHILSKYKDEWEDFVESDDADINNSEDQYNFLVGIDDDFDTATTQAYFLGQESGTLGEMIDVFKSSLEDVEIEAEGETLGVRLSEDWIDGPVFTVLETNEVIKIYDRMVMENENSPYEYYTMEEHADFIGRLNVPHYGFDGFDKDSAMEGFENNWTHHRIDKIYDKMNQNNPK